MVEWPDGPRLFEHLKDLPGPLRVADLPGYLHSLGLSPLPPWDARTLQGTPMHHRGEHLGNFFLGNKENGEAFTAEDEEILILFASQAATAIANARTHRDVERARADLEALVETSPVGVGVFDAATGRAVLFNREARRIAEGLRTPGHPAEQLLEVMTCRHADGREYSLEELPLAGQLEDATTMRAEEVVLSVPDGRSVRTLVNVTPIHSEEGEVVSVVVTVQDLAPLDDLERQRVEFLGMVSHELRAPLTSIKGSTATVLHAAPVPPQAEMLQFFRIIDGQADHMRGLIANLLDAGSIEAGTLTIAPEDGYIALSVSDQGRGIPPDRLPHLFRKRAGLAGGTGLGLAISKGLVEAHGGRIQAESGGAGLGARFTFTIPAAGDAAPEAAPPAGTLRPPGERGEKTRILVVDDDPETLRYVRDTLSDAGYAPLVTGDPDELSAIIRAERPRLVLLDLMLPGTDGIELMKRVPDLADLPVIFISGYGRDETIAKALESGAADYIVKPFSPTELVARVHAALRSRSEPETFVLGDLAVDYGRRRVTVAGRAVPLTATEFDLLRALSRQAGQVVTTETLLRQVWGRRGSDDNDRVRTVVKKLRAKLGDNAAAPTYIFTEHGVGYRIGDPGRGVEGPRAGRHRLGERPSRAAAQPPCLPCRGYCSSFQSERVAQSQSPWASLLSARASSRSPSPRRTERSTRSTRRPRSASPAARATA